MSIPEVELTIKEQGPRVLATYGQAYHAGWAAGLRRAADKAPDEMKVEHR